MALIGKLIADSNDNAATALVGGGIVVVVIYLLVLAAIVILVVSIWWKIFSKAGYSGVLSLLMFVPVANLIMILILAFGDWPVHRELRQLRAMAAGGGYAKGPPTRGYTQDNPQQRQS